MRKRNISRGTDNRELIQSLPKVKKKEEDVQSNSVYTFNLYNERNVSRK